MRRALLLVLAVLPLAAFDCGGGEPPPLGCTLRVGGEVSEDLWCIVTVYDYSAMPSVPPEADDMFVFMLVAYRGGPMSMEVGGEASFWLPARASTGVAYGWNGSTASNVDAGDAARYPPAIGGDGLSFPTHSADPWSGTGAMSVTLTSIPPATAQGAELLAVHGTLSATLPSDGAGQPVTFSATF